MINKTYRKIVKNEWEHAERLKNLLDIFIEQKDPNMAIFYASALIQYLTNAWYYMERIAKTEEEE